MVEEYGLPKLAYGIPANSGGLLVGVGEAHELLQVLHREAVSGRVARVDEHESSEVDAVPSRLRDGVLH